MAWRNPTGREWVDFERLSVDAGGELSMLHKQLLPPAPQSLVGETGATKSPAVPSQNWDTMQPRG